MHIYDISTVEISIEALDELPESIARESCILPVRLVESSLHILHPVDSDPSSTIDKLEFVLNRTITFDTCDRHAIEAAINCHYPTASQDAERCDLPDSLPALDVEAEYTFFDLIGKIEFNTSASISFRLGKKSDYIKYADGSQSYCGKDGVFIVLGWLDVHYPCVGFHKLQVRCSLPGDHVSYELMRDLIFQLCAVLALPVNTPYKINQQAHGSARSMANPQEGFACTTKWRLPGECEDENPNDDYDGNTR